MDKELRGVLNLDGTIRDFYEERIIRADLSVDSLGYSEYELGNVKASSRYFAELSKLSLSGNLTRGVDRILDFKGDYLIGEDDPLNGKLFLNEFNLSVLNAFEIPQINEYS